MMSKMTEAKQNEHCPCWWKQNSKQEAEHNALTSEVKHKGRRFETASSHMMASEILP